MMTYLFMGLLVAAMALLFLWGLKKDPNKDSFMSMEDTSFLRGFWCIIVVLVHVPAAYQNTIQDAMGSFAYIGVTFFFMTYVLICVGMQSGRLFYGVQDHAHMAC